MQKSAVAFGVKQKRIGEGMENKEFEKEFEQISQIGNHNVFIVFDSGSMYANKYAIETDILSKEIRIYLFTANDGFVGSILLSAIIEVS